MKISQSGKLRDGRGGRGSCRAVISRWVRLGRSLALPCLVLTLISCQTRRATESEEQLASAARGVYEWLQKREDAGEQLTPTFIEMKCTWSRRWCAAEVGAARTNQQRLDAIDAHIARMQRVRVIYGKGDYSFLQLYSDYFVREAELWKQQIK